MSFIVPGLCLALVGIVIYVISRHDPKDIDADFLEYEKDLMIRRLAKLNEKRRLH